jgi:hypothetical protein
MGQYGGVWAHDESRKSFGIAGADLVDAPAFSLPVDALFYCDVFPCRLAVREADVALLLTPKGFQIYLHQRDQFRRRGAGVRGVDYLMWATDSQSDLQRIAGRLRAYDSAVFSHEADGMTILEGTDRDGFRRIDFAADPCCGPPDHRHRKPIRHSDVLRALSGEGRGAIDCRLWGRPSRACSRFHLAPESFIRD